MSIHFDYSVKQLMKNISDVWCYHLSFLSKSCNKMCMLLLLLLYETHHLSIKMTCMCFSCWTGIEAGKACHTSNYTVVISSKRLKWRGCGSSLFNCICESSILFSRFDKCSSCIYFKNTQCQCNFKSHITLLQSEHLYRYIRQMVVLENFQENMFILGQEWTL